VDEAIKREGFKNVESYIYLLVVRHYATFKDVFDNVCNLGKYSCAYNTFRDAYRKLYCRSIRRVIRFDFKDEGEIAEWNRRAKERGYNNIKKGIVELKRKGLSDKKMAEIFGVSIKVFRRRKAIIFMKRIEQWKRELR